MIFKVSTLGYIVDWDKASSKEKDAMMRALERVRTAYIFETRRIIKSSEDAKDCSVQELMLGHKCKSHDIVSVFKGVEETWRTTIILQNQKMVKYHIIQWQILLNLLINNY